MESLFVLQTTDGAWEEVDDYIYLNHKFVVDEKGVPRYSGNRFSVEEGTVSLKNLSIKEDELGMIARISGAKVPMGSSSQGFAPKPQTLLRVKRGGGLIFYEIETGRKYTLAKSKKKKAPAVI